MAWEHFEKRASGECKAVRNADGTVVPGTYEMGIITTGKSRMFEGYFIYVRIENLEIIGKSKGNCDSYRLALDDCNDRLDKEGLRLMVAGNAPTYSESALSGVSGYGYISGGRDPLGIMAFTE